MLTSSGEWLCPECTTNSGLEVRVARSVVKRFVHAIAPSPTSAADVALGDDKAAPGTAPSYGPVSVTVTATGPAVLGVSYPPSLSPQSGSPLSLTVETSRGHWAPSGCFAATWVPTLADIKTTSASAAAAAAAAASADGSGAGSVDVDLQLSGLGARARAAFAESAAVTARLYAGGRHSLQDYDLVDVLPLAQPWAPGNGGGGGGRGRAARKSMSMSVGDASASRRGSMLPTAGSAAGQLAPSAGKSSLVVRDSPGAVLEHPLAALGASCPALAARVHAGAGRGVFAPSAAFLTPSSETLDGVPGGYRMLDRRTVRAWFPGRVMRTRTPPAAGSSSDSGAAAASAGGAKAAAVSEAVVYWFQPARLPDGSGGERFALALHCQPVASVAGLAPAGTFTVPYVPGQTLEARSLSSPWAVAEVVYADRYCLRLRLPRSLSAGSKGGGGASDSLGRRERSSLTRVVIQSKASGDLDGAAASSPLLAMAARDKVTQGSASGAAANQRPPRDDSAGRGGPPVTPPPPPPRPPPRAAAAAASVDLASGETGEEGATASPPTADGSEGGSAAPAVVGGGGRPPKPPPRPAVPPRPDASAASPPTAAAAAPSPAPLQERRRRTSSLLMGIPQLPEPGLATVPHQLWQLLVARTGHYCLRDGTPGPPAGPLPPPPSSGGFGFRLFSSGSSTAASTAGPLAGVARALTKQGHRGSFA